MSEAYLSPLVAWPVNTARTSPPSRMQDTSVGDIDHGRRMKGGSPVTRQRQAELEINEYLRRHLVASVLEAFVREADAEWGRVQDERPYFQVPGRPPHIVGPRVSAVESPEVTIEPMRVSREGGPLHRASQESATHGHRRAAR